MFKQLTILALSVLLSTSAFAQTKKKSAKKPAKKPAASKPAASKTEPLPDTAPAATEAEATPAPVAEPVAEPAPAPAVASNSGKISQYNWQAGDGQSAVEVSLGYGMGSLKYNNKATGVEGGKVDVTKMPIGISYEYGFSAKNSVGIKTEYSMNSRKDTPTGSTTTSDSKTTGLGDIFIVSKNYCDMSGSKLLYGVSLGFSPGKHKDAITTPASAAADGNNYSGGLSLPIYLGWEADTGGGAWGLRLDYGLMMERSVEGATAATETKLTGGNTMSFKGYYESGVESYWNAYLGLSTTADSDSKTGTAAAVPMKGDIPSAFVYGASWGTHLSPGMLLALHYDGSYVSKYDYNATTEIPAYMIHGLAVRARWEF